MKLKTLFPAAVLALLAACSGDDPTGPDIPGLIALPAGTTIVTTASGLQYADVALGSGPAAADSSQVAVHYTAWLADGTGFDTSVGLAPFPFKVGRHSVIAGFEEGVRGMRLGGKRRLFVPAELGYGASGVYDANGKLVIPPNSDLIFDVELVGLK